MFKTKFHCQNLVTFSLQDGWESMDLCDVWSGRLWKVRKDSHYYLWFTSFFSKLWILSNIILLYDVYLNYNKHCHGFMFIGFFTSCSFKRSFIATIIRRAHGEHVFTYISSYPSMCLAGSPVQMGVLKLAGIKTKLSCSWFIVSNWPCTGNFRVLLCACLVFFFK